MIISGLFQPVKPLQKQYKWLFLYKFNRHHLETIKMIGAGNTLHHWCPKKSPNQYLIQLLHIRLLKRKKLCEIFPCYLFYSYIHHQYWQVSGSSDGGRIKRVSSFTHLKRIVNQTHSLHSTTRAKHLSCCTQKGVTCFCLNARADQTLFLVKIHFDPSKRRNGSGVSE